MQVWISNVYSFGDSRQLTRNCAGHGPREKEITLLLNASRADRVKNITYVKYEVCQLVESASSLLALDIARESKVSALGLKFLGPAQRFTRSRGYRLSSQEVMPSSRREYQILHRYTPLSTLPSAYLARIQTRVPGRTAGIYVWANLSALKNLRKFPRTRISAEGCAARKSRIITLLVWPCSGKILISISTWHHLIRTNKGRRRRPAFAITSHDWFNLINCPRAHALKDSQSLADV